MGKTYLGQANAVEDQEATWPILICLLGNFRLLRAGEPVVWRNAGKLQSLLCNLALAGEQAVTREALLQSLWPDTDVRLAGQSLNNLIYTLRKTCGNQLDGASPVLSSDGYYRLNVEAGVAVDIGLFHATARFGQELARAGDQAGALSAYRAAIKFYRGDLCGGNSIPEVIERERLRALYLTLLAALADDAFAHQDCAACLEFTGRLLSIDPFREDVHRLIMRCHARLGERAQALRQYRLCENLLRTEFDAAPEPATRNLFDQIRLAPDRAQPE